MSNRKLVSVQEITNIEPIEGADRIEVARILGWRVVVGKDMHLKPGDRVAYFETDSLLPAYDPRMRTWRGRMPVPGADGLRFHADRRMAVQRGSESVHVVAYARRRRRLVLQRRTVCGSRRSLEPAARCGLERHHGDQPRG